MSLKKLETVLREIGPAAIAVSGGIDSLVLAKLAFDTHPDSIAFHAISSAVPKAATARVEDVGRFHGWTVQKIDAGEFSDKRYVSNPVNRCFYCKTRLYGAIASQSDLPILSGTNLDDLSDFRPGLEAAKDHGIRHPYVEAGVTKEDVRTAARTIGLDALADLPAAPCLSSRITTGVPIDARKLDVIDRIEEMAREALGNITLRCRHDRAGFFLAIGEPQFSVLSEPEKHRLVTKIRGMIRPGDHFSGIAPYRQGSAFVQPN